MSLQLFDVWQDKYPALVDEFFLGGLHTVRYSQRNWSGHWSDMAIEESVMRDAKTSGGLVHGTLRNIDSSLDTWFLYASHTAEVSLFCCCSFPLSQLIMYDKFREF